MLPVFRPWHYGPIGQCPNSYDPVVPECIKMWADWKAGLRFVGQDIGKLPAFIKQGLTHCENTAAEYWEGKRKSAESKSPPTKDVGQKKGRIALGR